MTKKITFIILSAILFVAIVASVAFAFEPDEQADCSAEPSVEVSTYDGSGDDVSYRDIFSEYESIKDASLLSAEFSETVITRDQNKLELVFVAPEKTCFCYGYYHTLEQFKNGAWIRINEKPDTCWFEVAILGVNGSTLPIDLDKFDFDRAPGRYRVSVEIYAVTLYAEFEIR